MRQFRVVSSLAVGILVWALVFAGCSGSSTITITLSPASGVSLNPGATQTITATLTNDKNNQGVTWTLSGPGQLSSNTTTSVVYTAPANISTAATATVTATSVANSTITATESITLNAVLTIVTTSLPAGTLQTAYNTFVSATGATGTFTWSVIAGSLPPGLTFQTTSTSSSAEITGTPTVLGKYKFTVQVTDSSGNTVTQALSITINPPPPLAVATGSLPNGQVNVPYNQTTLQASSGTPPYTWALINGTILPIGLTLTPSGVISGTPIATGISSFTVQVTDSSTPTPQTASANLTITVTQGNTDNARLSGNYAFMVTGFDSITPPLPVFVAAGSFVADGSGNISAGLMDINDTGYDPRNPTFTGTYSIGPNGVGFMTLNSTDIVPTRTFALSMMANGNANIIEFDDTTGGFIHGSARNSGVLLKQDTTAFTGAPASATYAFGFSGIDSTRNRYGVAGVFSSNGSGGLTGISQDSDDAGTILSQSGLTGTSTAVDSNGRGTMTINTAIYSFYVVTGSEMLVVGIDTFAPGGNPLVSGTILQQSCSGCFTNSSFSAPSVFEITALNASQAESQVGVFNGISGGFNLTSDQNSGGTVTQPSGSGTYNVATNGRVSVTPNASTGSGFQNTTPTSPQPVFYMVTDNEAFIVGTDSAVSFGLMTVQSGLPFTAASLSGTYAGGSLAPVDPSVSNVISIAVAGSGKLNVSADASGPNGLSEIPQTSATTAVAANGRVVVQVNQSTVEILYMVSPQEFFALDAATGDTTARVDIFQQ